MLGASLYIVVCSTRNRILVRLRRLREPRYLVGALFGAAYLYFALIVPRRAAGSRRGGRDLPRGPNLERFGLSLGGVGLLLMGSLAWIFPGSSTLLTFTDAETDFLFPAPMSRRQVVIHRIIRSQLGLLFAAMIPAFFMTPPGRGSIPEIALRALALWVIFSTIRVYFAGIAMARARLGSGDPRARRVAWAPLVATLAAVAVVGVPLAQAMPVFPVPSFSDAIARLSDATTTGMSGVVLWPFRTLIRPLFTDGLSSYVVAIAGSLLVFLATTAWVLASDAVFQEATDDQLMFKARSARQRRTPAPRLRWAGWTLPLSGPTETVFLWKNAMQTLRGLNIGSVLPPLIGITLGMVGATIGVSQSRGLASALFTVILGLAGAATLFGPMSVMTDLRGDLRHLEVIKTWPVKGGALLRGEILWPGTLLTVLAWVAIVIGTVLSVTAVPEASLAWRLALCATAMLAMPTLVFAQYTIHHAVAVMFPAWIPPDNEMRGFESMAQRLLLLAAVMLSLIAMVGPGAVAGGIVGFVFYRLIESPFVFVPAAAVCLAIVAVEIVLATEALGPAYERIDLSGLERAE